MDPAEKKRLANEKRLKAVQEWKKKRNQQIKLKMATENFGLSVNEKEKGKLKLFVSDDEEENCDDIFKVRPQFEGQKGQHLLEMSSQFSSRFKLDERFKDDEEPSSTCVSVAEENEEKAKNIKILESILGYEVGEKHPEGIGLSKKKLIKRFDPSDESTSKFVKINKVSEAKPQKKIRKKEELVQGKEDIPVSSERYIEVSSNLKDILSSSSSQFTLTQKFNFSNEENDGIIDNLGDSFQTKEHNSYPAVRVRKSDVKKQFLIKQKDVFESKNLFTFFICEGDERLKEGVEFFMRPKPMEEIREEWNRRKDDVLELFRKI